MSRSGMAAISSSECSPAMHLGLMFMSGFAASRRLEMIHLVSRVMFAFFVLIRSASLMTLASKSVHLPSPGVSVSTTGSPNGKSFGYLPFSAKRKQYLTSSAVNLFSAVPFAVPPHITAKKSFGPFLTSHTGTPGCSPSHAWPFGPVQRVIGSLFPSAQVSECLVQTTWG